MSSKQQFEIVHGFPAGADMDIHTEQAWTLWQSAWSAAVASRPDLDDLSLENSLVRARNERLEKDIEVCQRALVQAHAQLAVQS
jgi:hypothetical protein